MFIVPSATFRLLFVMLTLTHDRPKIAPLRPHAASDREVFIARASLVDHVERSCGTVTVVVAVAAFPDASVHCTVSV
jgi:hypothetical protein